MGASIPEKEARTTAISLCGIRRHFPLARSWINISAVKASSLMEISMNKRVLAVTTSAFLLVYGSLTGSAQQGPGNPMMRQPDQQQMHDQEAQEDMCGGRMGHGKGGRGMMGGGMMGGGMMGQRTMDPVAMRIIFALMDADGDGTVSLQEFQAAHEKIFKAMDVDKDGTVSFEEMMNFMQGGKRSTPQR